MKETKVYVEELPKECWDCPCFKTDLECSCGLSDGTQDYFKDEIDGENCPLKLLKTHDRALVKEVCEKIRTMAHKVGKLVFCEHCYKTNSARAIDEHLLNEILGQIESEFEQKEYEK